MSNYPGNAVKGDFLGHVNRDIKANILAVDDCPLSTQALVFALEDDGHSVTVVHCGKHALHQVREVKPDLILLDLQMPEMNGVQVLSALKGDLVTADIPVIMVSSSNSDADIALALDMGAHDYVVKPVNYRVLAARMRSALRLSYVQKQLVKINARLEREASTDALTELYNRRQFMLLSKIEFTRERRSKKNLSLILMDIDNFKRINDEYGHSSGDAVLQNLAKVMTDNARKSDISARIGGEEFVITLPEAGFDDALAMAERIRLLVSEQCLIVENQSIHYTVSIGVTSLVEDDTKIEDLLLRADQYLYGSKRCGKNRVLGGLALCKSSPYEKNQTDITYGDAAERMAPPTITRQL